MAFGEISAIRYVIAQLCSNCVYTGRKETRSDAKQPKCDVIDNLRKVANGRKLPERSLNFTKTKLLIHSLMMNVGLFCASDASNHSRRLPTLASHCFASSVNAPLADLSKQKILR